MVLVPISGTRHSTRIVPFVRAILSLGVAAALAGLAACGAGADADTNDGRAHVVVTTTVLGDIVRHVVGAEADVEVIMPVGADAHEFSPSTRQAEAMTDAELLVVNGAGLEQPMAGLIGRARRVFTFADHVRLRTVGGVVDPHLWADPNEVSAAVGALGAAVGALPGVDAATVRRQASDYAAALGALDAEVVRTLAPIAAARRKLVTTHDAFGYFAARYDLHLIGAAIPSLTTSAASSAAGIERLADAVRREHVPAVFAETSQPTKLIDALADEVGGDIAVVELYTESLGAPGSSADTYVGMLRTDARRIAEALA
jgi:zinc/manganese transport system substrate-binding protein